MNNIAIHTTLAGALVNGLATAPLITIRNIATGAIVAGPSAMTDQGAQGLYTFAFTGARGDRHSALIDADPLAAGQTDVRYFEATMDREIYDLWRTRGLDPSTPKTTTEAVAGLDYDEDVGDIHIDQVKVGAVTTATST